MLRHKKQINCIYVTSISISEQQTKALPQPELRNVTIQLYKLKSKRQFTTKRV